MLQKTPFSFDVSVWEFFWPLIIGAALVMAQPGGHQDPAYLAELITSERITTLHFVPSMLQVFLRGAGGRGLHLAAAGDLLGRSAVARPGDAASSSSMPDRRAAQPVRADRGGDRRHLLGLPA